MILRMSLELRRKADRVCEELDLPLSEVIRQSLELLYEIQEAGNLELYNKWAGKLTRPAKRQERSETRIAVKTKRPAGPEERDRRPESGTMRHNPEGGRPERSGEKAKPRAI